jgi:hypothetical protein
MRQCRVDGAKRCLTACPVAVETQGRLGHEPPQQLDLFFGQRGPQWGDGSGEPCFRQRHHVHVAFHHDDPPGLVSLGAGTSSVE